MPPKISEYLAPVIVSIALHGLLLWILSGIGAEAPERKQYKPPNYVKAELVQLKAKVKEKPKKQTVKKQKKKVDLTKKREAEKKKKREAEKKRKRLAAEKKKKAQAAKKKKEAKEKKRKAEEAAQKKREQARLKKEDAERERLEFEKALQAEERALIEEQAEIEAQSYISIFKQRVEQRWSRPPSARKGMACSLRIEMIPNGQIISVEVVKGSGNAAFDRSAKQAVQSLDRFDEIKGIDRDLFEKYFRHITFKFTPEDLRL